MTDQSKFNDGDDSDDSSGETWEREMSSEFDRRVRDLHEAPLSVDQVRGRATSIRRRRQVAAAAAVLATAAVVTPVALLALDDSAGDATPIQPADPDSTAIDSEAPADRQLEPTYVEGDVLRLPDGSAYDLPKATYESAVQLGDRVVAVARDNQNNVTVDVIEGGDVVESYDTSGDLSISTERQVAAFVTRAGEVQTIWSDGERVLADGYQGWSVRGVDGGGSGCADPDVGGGCQVVLVDQIGTEGAVVVDSAGGATNPVPGAIDIRDVDGGSYAVVTEVDDLEPSSCGGVYDVVAGDFTFTTCEHTLMQFSPDGRYLTGFPSYLSGFGPSTISIVDATTGDELGRVESGPGQALSRATWVDDDTLAVTLFDIGAQEWTLLSLTVGDEEPVVAAGPAPGTDFAPSFGITGR